VRASVPQGRPIGPRCDRAPTGNNVRIANEAQRRAGRCAPSGPRVFGDRAVCSTKTRPTPIEFPLPTSAEL